MAGASIAAAVAMEAETPQTPTPEERVAAKLRSSPIFLEIRKAIIHTTGNERNAAASILGALVTKVVSRILAPKSTMAILMKSSPLAESFNHDGIRVTFATTIPTNKAIMYPTSALPITFTTGA